jgi:prepilin-type N-terminal cleavage/methylation domain-containing protein
MPRAPLARQHGFTLIELIITMVLVGILTAFGASMIYSNMTTVISVNSGQATLDQARIAIARVARELREVKYTTSFTYSITSTMAPSSTSVTFVRSIGGSDVTVTLAKSGSDLTLQYSSPAVTSTLVSGVTSLSLDFYDGNGAVTASTTDVRFVSIALAVTDATSGQTVSQRTRVALRNG